MSACMCECFVRVVCAVCALNVCVRACVRVCVLCLCVRVCSVVCLSVGSKMEGCYALTMSFMYNLFALTGFQSFCCGVFTLFAGSIFQSAVAFLKSVALAFFVQSLCFDIVQAGSVACVVGERLPCRARAPVPAECVCVCVCVLCVCVCLCVRVCVCVCV